MSWLADTATRWKIHAALATDGHLSAWSIRVVVEDGVAWLQGTVHYEAQRMLAEATAIRNGARRVVNALLVRDPFHHAESAILPSEARGVTTPAGARPVRSTADSPAIAVLPRRRAQRVRVRAHA